MNLPAFLTPSPPDVAVDIAPGRVAVARVERRGDGYALAAHAVEALADGAVSGALAALNMPDVSAVAAAVTRALSAAGIRPGRVALVVPDSIARVSLVRFENVPARAADRDELIRWQVKKTTPFPIDDAVVGYTAGASVAGAHEFVVSVARRDVVEQYEAACAAAGCHAGIVDLATFNVVNAVLAGGRATRGDWLLVHAAATYVSLAVIRDGHLIFYRTRGEESEGSIADLVHQTAMYYEDRLSGQRFDGVLLAGGATAAGADHLRDYLSERLGLEVAPVDPFSAAAATGRRTSTLADLVAPSVGLLLREGTGA
jgi:type IV pilus assembly protein PilM